MSCQKTLCMLIIPLARWTKISHSGLSWVLNENLSPLEAEAEVILALEESLV